MELERADRAHSTRAEGSGRAGAAGEPARAHPGGQSAELGAHDTPPWAGAATPKLDLVALATPVCRNPCPRPGVQLRRVGRGRENYTASPKMYFPAVTGPFHSFLLNTVLLLLLLLK